MRWEKKGLIYCPKGENEWMNNSVLTPQPFLLNPRVIRIYASFRDAKGIGRIGYMDLDSHNPKKILKISPKPVLDIGKNGCFDDNGLILGDVLRVGDKIYMYYVAFQIPQKVKFLAFSGLAVSEDNGESFVRVQSNPVLDRSSEGIFGRCIHSVRYEGGIFRVWYSVIHQWTLINDIPYPTYFIKYIESRDGITFGSEGKTCVQTQGSEYRIGRPKVYKTQGGYEMYYTSDNLDKEYKAGVAFSENGITWERRDKECGLEPSTSGFDSDMACYPALLEVGEKTYCFYGGNGMGQSGFGYAELAQ
ncbi:hypothetical protein OQH61_09115 [Helicobacter sp. MIT 21-1697]|uniref:hypothetical protein n=1 Tax=Helicobacter sp. MIT 21-1697 TaxID=2993733 RepID=UPI00224ABC46|nr:hypothetical protein [Helicobacter sp. MIT 21-1697]MCX2717892.1 hypothetical protein [Helicobacter sp. MIT 21-1697]